MRHQPIYKPIRRGIEKGFLSCAVIEADQAEATQTAAFVEEMYGVTPEALVQYGLSLFPGVLHVSIQKDNRSPLQEEDLLLAWDNTNQRTNIVALRPGNSLTIDRQMGIKAKCSWPTAINEDGDSGFIVTSRDVRLEVIFSNIDQIRLKRKKALLALNV